MPNPLSVRTRLAGATAALAASAVLAMMTGPAQATVVIDDFSSGRGGFDFVTNPGGTSHLQERDGSMASGHRQWVLQLNGPTGSTALVDIGNPAGSGFRARGTPGVNHRFDWSYGATYAFGNHTMSLDLSAEDRLRVEFAALPDWLNFNVLVYYRNQVDNYSQVGFTVGPSAGPVTVDFLFSDFAAVIADPSRPADFSQVSGIYLVTQGPLGAGGFTMASISAVPEPATAAMSLAGLALLLARRRIVSRRLNGGDEP
jgi:hypothetical protein